MWAETQTQRFAAAVAGAGLSDWLSYYGVNDIDEWMIPFFGASIYDDPAVYAKSDPMPSRRLIASTITPRSCRIRELSRVLPANVDEEVM